MKNLRFFSVLFLLVFSLSSCSLWSKVFKPKEGCGSNGKNVGAEKLMTGEKVPKAKKFRA